ncbi:CDP-diacylglycerol--serine O-phosphatidyltransferase [Lutibaculum baratangense]|uniref:CDP-diacylglycerol--serine O-phosphatidyltransferase n=1 Tax=Lutibaculum baratangense AMV1 TaxID=631454 RepID=V4RI33_9HYPH|nr:CDP-diacylglycerol--serine O-phosphatidyltransferase [Lutibaculum baratangense]ESR22925.1 CDP-diacylglycerol--serine O-phosphatidyltransferase [Lutibaculum baratangense AMV1]
METPFQPFEPDPQPKERRSFRGVPLRMLVPNMITLLALCAGLTAIRMAYEGRIELAIAAILFAAILDMLDGRVARMLRSTSRFGAELDSLSDFVNFGVAPAILLHAWLLDHLGNIGWISGLVFALCSALRLARFNAQLDQPKKPSWMGNFFVGVPAPAGAIAVLLPVYLQLMGMDYTPEGAPLVLAYELGIAFLMVSTIPTFSSKRITMRVPREYVLPTFVAVVIVVALFVSFPWASLTFWTVVYVCTVPAAPFAYRRMKKRYGSSLSAEEAGRP